MSEIIQRYSPQFVDENGVVYDVSACGEPSGDGNWQGWLEFHPEDASKPRLRTARETTQPDRRALEYWATGLEPLYFEGAFERARPE